MTYNFTQKATSLLVASAVLVGLSISPVMADDNVSTTSTTEVTEITETVKEKRHKGDKGDKGHWWMEDSAEATERYNALSDEKKARIDKKREKFASMTAEERTAQIERMEERRTKMKAELEGLSPDERRAKMKELRKEFKEERKARRAQETE